LAHVRAADVVGAYGGPARWCDALGCRAQSVAPAGVRGSGGGVELRDDGAADQPDVVQHAAPAPGRGGDRDPVLMVEPPSREMRSMREYRKNGRAGGGAAALRALRRRALACVGVLGLVVAGCDLEVT